MASEDDTETHIVKNEIFVGMLNQGIAWAVSLR